jgi:hypothetical protein
LGYYRAIDHSDLQGPSSMRIRVSLLAVTLLAFTVAAHADTYYYTFTGTGVDTFSFSIPSVYQSNGGNDLGIYPTAEVDLDGVTSIRQIGFYVPANLGGLAFTSSTDPFEFVGPQLFTGELVDVFPGFPGFYANGTFLLGTFTLEELQGNQVGGFGTLTVTDGPPVAPSVPEPSTIALFSTGLLATAGTLRRKFFR